MMNFEFANPTRIVFGRDQYGRLPELLNDYSKKRKILLAYGGGSIKNNGLYNKIHSFLKDFEIVDFGGIEPNLQFSTLMKGVELARKEEVDFILAVGGGSVIDGVKFMTGAFYYEGDPWEVLLKKEGCQFKKALPFGVVLTLPATGSEANGGAVISRQESLEKMVMSGPLFFPVFSFCDPSLVASLPKRQITNGIVDAFMHTMEQYLTYPTENLLQEREAEAILKTLIEIGPGLIEHPNNYKYAANLMVCATHALNENLRCGVPTDWATHMIGHELTAYYGIDHARTLAIIAPRLYRNQFENKKEKLVQYGKRVWNLEGTAEVIAESAIVKTEEFFNFLGIQTKISDYSADTDHIAEIVKNRFIQRNWIALGERQKITPTDVEEIILNSI